MTINVKWAMAAKLGDRRFLFRLHRPKIREMTNHEALH